MKEIIKNIKSDYRLSILSIVIAGIIAGLGLLIVVESEAGSYLGDEPSTCINCHIMAPFYATWLHSSHGRNTTCNDCHVPHTSFFRKWYFKGNDGMRHAAIFTMNAQPQVIQARTESAEAILENCIRCHHQLNTEYIAYGQMDYTAIIDGNGKACWDCHRDVPHGGKNSLSSTPNALVPYPVNEVPEWLQKITDKNAPN